MKIISACLFSATYFFSLSTFAFAFPGFPGAEGFGKDAIGGRGGSVIEVTNLNNSGSGSLRAALETSGPRTVVFRTGGVIQLNDNISVNNPYLTIAGQTAPGDGICIKGAPITITTHDVIIRGIRSRPGDGTGTDIGNRDALQIEGYDVSYDIIVDHCSFSWSTDEIFTTWGRTSNITIQQCIFSEGLAYNSAKGVLFGPGTERVSFHHNLIAHIEERAPYPGGTTSRSDRGATDIEVINNVIYNWIYYAGRMMSNPGSNDPGQKAHWFSNIWQAGADTTSSYSLTFRDSDLVDGTRIYIKGNIGPGRPIDSGDEWNLVSPNYDSQFRYDDYLFTPTGIVTSSAVEAYDSVLNSAGATAPARDSVDARIVQSVRDVTGAIIDRLSDVGGYPTYGAGTPPTDTDHDGMPDSWENTYGLNPNDASDRNGDLDGDGYTNLEEYLNSFFTSPPTPPALFRRGNTPIIL